MAVVFDAITTADASSSGSVTTLALNTMTVGTGSNRALIALLAFKPGVTALTVFWDSAGANQAMTLIGSASNSANTVTSYLYGLVNPVSGNKTLTASWTGAITCNIDAIAFTGVDQTGGATSFPNFTSAIGTSTAAAVSVTSNANSYVVGMSENSSVNITAMDHQTIHIDNSHAGFGGNYDVGAASVTLGATNGVTSVSWVSIGTSVAPAGSGTAPTGGGTPTEGGTGFRRILHYQSYARPVFITPVPFGWLTPLSSPTRRAAAIAPDWPLIPQQTAAAVSTAVYAADVSSPGPTFKWRLIYRTKTEPVFVPPQTTTTAVFTQWPDFAPRTRAAVNTQPWAFIQSPAQVFFPYAPWDDFARRKPTPLDTQPLAWPPTPVVAPFPAMGWINWPDFATRAKRAADLIPWTFIPPAAQVWFPYGPWDDFARRKPQPLDTQPLAYSTTQIAAPIPVMAWTNWPDFAPKTRPPLNFDALAEVQLAPQVWFPYGPWDDFTRRRPQYPDTQPLIWTGQTIAAPAPTMAWVSWPDFAPKKPVPLNFNPLALVQLAPQVWYPPNTWPELVPTRPKPVVDFIPWSFVAPFPAFPWTQWTSWPEIVPTRKKPVVDFQPWVFIEPPPQVFSPYGPWDDFARRKPQPLDTQPLIWSSFTPPPGFFLVPDRWPDLVYRKPIPLNFVPLTLVQTVQAPWTQWTQWPDRIWKKSPPVETQPLAYLQTVRTPWNEMSRWPELVPIRGKKGLLVPLHPAFFMFPGKITGATITIIMAAHETNADTALWAINVLSSPQPSAVSAAVSIEEGFGGMGATSIVEH